MAKRIRSAIKKNRQSLKRRARNVHMLSLLKTITKEADAAIKAQDVTKSLEILKIAESTLKKAASKGIIHKRTASRSVSRLSKRVYELTKNTAT
ncbi:MAG: 30S ribosomal protein S20 [Candidatus Dadabacteria bacterium]|nr:30S ribosomal protein S20 [Candidatus Dadabacteria bacterium]